VAGAFPVAGGQPAVAQAEQRVGLVVAVAGVPIEVDGPAVAGSGSVGVAEVVVDAAEAVPGVRLPYGSAISWLRRTARWQ
jgi:hypothetical protein